MKLLSIKWNARGEISGLKNIWRLFEFSEA